MKLNILPWLRSFGQQQSWTEIVNQSVRLNPLSSLPGKLGDKWRYIMQKTAWGPLEGAHRLLLTGDESAWELMQATNAAVNNHCSYHEDAADTWKTPMEFTYDRRGDCEDFAIMKFYDLWLRGFPDAALELMIVSIRPGNTAFKNNRLYHMVVCVHLTDETVYLDITDDQVHDASDLKKNYNPIVGLNRLGWRKF